MPTPLSRSAAALLACCLSSSVAALAVSPDSETGNLTLAPALPTAPDPRTVTLTLEGWSALANTQELGSFTLTYLDDPTLSAAIFRLHRPAGKYEWQLSRELPVAPFSEDRLAMELRDDHTLRVHPVTSGPGAKEILLQPGLNGGVFVGGQRLATLDEITPAAPATLTVAGGTIVGVHNAFYAGMFSVGPGSIASGDHSVAIGSGAKTAGPHGMALGKDTYAQQYAVAIGPSALANQYSAAFGLGAKGLAWGGTAIGQGAEAAGIWSTAVSGYTFAPYGLALAGQVNAPFAISLGGTANGQSSLGGIWGTADGYAAIAFGGYAAGMKSFAANSGTTWHAADYSTAIGRGTFTNLPYQTALGRYNEEPTSEDLLVIGNGTIDETNPAQPIEHRSNALVVKKNGDVHVSGVLRVPAAGDISMGAFTSGTLPAGN